MTIFTSPVHRLIFLRNSRYNRVIPYRSFTMGFNTEKVPLSAPATKSLEDLSKALNVYPFDCTMYAENRNRVVKKFQENRFVPKHSLLLLQGGSSPTRYETDHEPLFRQESNFAYLTGVKEPDCFLTIDVETKDSTLFIPRLPAEYAVWMGKIRSCEDFKQEYKVEQVKYVDELHSFIADYDPEVIYTTRGYNADSRRYAVEAKFEGIEQFRVDNGVLYQELVKCRVIKTKKELHMLAHINRISSEAHIWVMRNIHPRMTEFQLESMFQHYVYFHGGCRHQAYTSICCSGPQGSILHYGHAGAPNDKVIGEDQICLLDMGAEFRCYTSDITCTIPSSGVFTEDQKLVYNAVLATQRKVMETMKPGISYVDMHRLAYEVVCDRLLQIGILHNGSLEELMQANLGAVFMPHGLGHFMGLDTHDVGGRPKHSEFPDQSKPGYASLRCCVVLEPGMVLTVEPGIYFNDYCLDTALASDCQSKYINESVLQRFRGMGGVRIEDDVIVTTTGIINMSQCPRDVDDVEATMKGEEWQIEKVDAQIDSEL